MDLTGLGPTAGSGYLATPKLGGASLSVTGGGLMTPQALCVASAAVKKR